MDPTTAVVLTGIITALPPTIVAITALIVSLRNSSVMQKVEKNTNSLSERLQASSLAQGKAEGREEQRLS